MNGAEHYREAERLIAESTRMVGAATANTFAEARAASCDLLTAAQVHATLALAAATVADRWVSPMRDNGGHDIFAGHSWGEAIA